MAADTPAESVRSIETLNREVKSLTRGSEEYHPKYISRFVTKAQTYVNLVGAGVDRAESQNFALKLLTNAKIPGQRFSALVASIVSTERYNQENQAQIASMTVAEAETVFRIAREYM